MLDFHNHVLPGVDDGPKEMSESIEMLKYASSQGITEIVQTVHFQHPKMHGRNVEFSYLKSILKELELHLQKEKIKIKIHLSAEVFYLPNLVNLIDNPLILIGKKKYMLIEFTNNIYPLNFEEEFYKLQLNNICPIIAHPERYRFVQNDINILNDWITRGYTIQIDAGSILGKFGKISKNISLEMIKNGFVHLIGSDAHNNKNRNFCIKEAYDFLRSNGYNEYVDILVNNSMNIFYDKEMKRYNKKEKKSIFSRFKLVNLFSRKIKKLYK